MSANSSVMVPTPTPQPRSRPTTPKSLVGNDNFLPEIRTSMNTIDRSKPLPTSLQSDFLPEELLFALTQPPPSKEKLGPPAKLRNLNTSTLAGRPPPSNVWNHKRREKFKHLTDNTTCVCGAGKDISFLYDVPLAEPQLERPDNEDESLVRNEFKDKQKQPLQLPDTLIPDEYHIVKNRGVMGIEFHEDKYSTQIEDHEKHLMLFPSMKPNSRYEVIQLRKVLDDLLKKVGANELDMDVRGPTQMHNLLELIKKEQNIYNVIFHELIRQTSVECSERGELLATLRKKYSDLLNRIPSQIKSLHEEVMAQRALDRRLTEELMRFKNTIGILTSELNEVKEHDRKVSREAQKAQEDLKYALSEAQKNSSLLSEYHDLYELQRLRLEQQVSTLTNERELWSTAAYSLAMKVTEECQLTTAKRLHVNEKAWAKLAHHFTILLSDKDTEVITVIQKHVEQWRDLIEDFNISLKQREENMRDNLQSLRGSIERWIQDFKKSCFNNEGMLIKPPDQAKMKILQSDIRVWEEILNKEAETFGGDVFLSNLDVLMKIRQEMESWTDAALHVFGRHRGLDGKTHPEQANMVQLNEEVDELLKQFHQRVTGENGVATSIIHLMNAVSGWENRITTALTGSMVIIDSEWGSFFFTLEDWIVAVDQGVSFIGTTQTEDDRAENKPHTSIDVHDTVRKTQKWMTTASSAIDSEDAKLVDHVSTLHSEMVHWMVQLLLRLAPDREDHSEEARHMALIGTASIPQLHEQVKTLFEKLSLFSSYVTLRTLEADGFVTFVTTDSFSHLKKKPTAVTISSLSIQLAFSCEGIVADNTQKRQDSLEDDADHELRDLHRLKTECDGWIHTAQILTSQLMGEPIHDLFPAKTTDKQKKTTSAREHRTIYSDKEKSDPKLDEDNSNVSVNKVEQSASVGESDVEQMPSQTEVPGDHSTQEQATPLSHVATDVQAEQTDTDAKQPADDVSKDKKLNEECLEKIGVDENTHFERLHHTLDQPPVPPSTPPSKDTPDTKKAYEALASVDKLQKQLLSTEERALAAEDRAAGAELELVQTQEKLRALERKIAALTETHEDEINHAQSQPEVGSSEKPKSASVAELKEEKKSDTKIKKSSAKKKK